MRKKLPVVVGGTNYYIEALLWDFLLQPLQVIIHCIMCLKISLKSVHTHTHLFNGPFSGITQVSRYQKGKTYLDLTGASDSEWQWHPRAICKSASRSRQITMPTPHYSVFYRPDALTAAQPTVSKH